MKVLPSIEENCVDIIMETDDDRMNIENLFYTENNYEFSKLLDDLRADRLISNLYDPNADKSKDLIHYFLISYSDNPLRYNERKKIVVKNSNKDKYGEVLRSLFERLSPNSKHYYSSYFNINSLMNKAKNSEIRTRERTKEVEENLVALAYYPDFRTFEQIKGIHKPAAEGVGTKGGKPKSKKKTRRTRSKKLTRKVLN